MTDIFDLGGIGEAQPSFFFDGFFFFFGNDSPVSQWLCPSCILGNEPLITPFFLLAL